MPLKLFKKKTPAEKFKASRERLGYKRINGKLTKPGTARFNEKVEFTTEEKNAIIDKYHQRYMEASGADKKIKENKIISKARQYNNKLDIIKDQRQREINRKEKNRKADLKKRQLKEWVRKLDSLLAVSKKGTVNEIKEKLFQELFKKEIRSIKLSLADKGLQAMRYDYLHRLFSTDFYNTLHSSFVPTNLERMSARDAINFIENISKKAKARKAEIYNEFRKIGE